MALGGGDGGTGRARIGGKRVSYPQFIRADAIASQSNATGDVSDNEASVDAPESTSEAQSYESTSEVEIRLRESISEGTSDIPEVEIKNRIREALSNAKPDVPDSQLFVISTPSSAETTSDEVLVTTVQSAKQSFSNSTSDTSDSEVEASIRESETEGVPDTAKSTDISVSDVFGGTAESVATTAITSYQAKLGGKVTRTKGGSGVDGAEVHIIRDNDDSHVASTTTDANGNWALSVPGKDGDDPDPPVYSIEVWYREGDKRDSNATVFNAANRPFIDTADPSGTDPYTDDFYYEKDNK